VSPVQIRTAWTYRLGAQVALVLEVENTSREQSWQTGDTTLVNTDGMGPKALSIWMDARLGPGERGHITLGAKALWKAGRGPFTLRLKDAKGSQTLTLKNIIFP
jgi:hypothetical protein